MRIDFATLAFGYSIKVGGGTPNWATSLGQGKEYKINDDPEIDNLLKGLVYSSVSLAKVSSKIGKGGRTVTGNEEGSPIITASVFSKVYINDKIIAGGKYVILITRDTSASHEGRLRFKYGPSNTYYEDANVYSNEMFWNHAKRQLGINENACLFVYDISIQNQDELILKTIIVDKDKPVEYVDSKDHHLHWDELIEEDEKRYGIVSLTTNKQDKVPIESKSTEERNFFEKDRKPRVVKLHPLNSIIYGAPGTGKTYSTVEYAQAIIKNISLDDFRSNNPDRKEVMKKYNELVRAGQIVFTTFHQSYGYEEFIQGLRPDTTSDKMSFETIDGVFKKIADRALNDDENNYVIIIDEINRANISKVFGELITLIEEDKRWGEINQTSATLQSGDVFAVPNNLYIVGTMNSADKSISLIDAALRRRFEFIEQKPDASLVADPDMRKVLEKLNGILADQLDSADLLIGHSYFMGKTKEDLPKVLNNSIIPLLYEYFYDNKKKVMGVLNNAIEPVDYVIEDDKLGRIFVERQKN